MSLDLHQKRFRVVLRYAAMSPALLARYCMHLERAAGSYGHVDETRSHLNRRIIGEADWMEKALAEIDDMKTENDAKELQVLSRQNRKKALTRRMMEGPKDPWRASRHGPMREVILTAHHDFFAGDVDAFLDPDGGNTREREFVKLGRSWLLDTFGKDVIEAHYDCDERSLHIHASSCPARRSRSNARARSTGHAACCSLPFTR